MKQTLANTRRLFFALDTLQYGSPLHEQKLKHAIRELCKVGTLQTMGECPKCGFVARMTTCPKCVRPLVPDSRKAS